MGLQDTIIEYLTEKGWYWDEVHFVEAWGHASDEKDRRTFHCWTIPQWGEYWAKPYHDQPGHANYGAPLERRYEDLKDALWSQLLREEEPETFAGFFKDRT